MRYYSVSFKNNIVWMYNEQTSDSKENYDLESDGSAAESALERLKDEISSIDGVSKAEISDGGHVIGIEADSEDYSGIMNEVVNLYRRFDEKSVVSYDFQLNMN